MTANEPLAGSTRRAARGQRQDVETVWSRLRAEFTLQDRFWIGFLFGAEAPEVAELVARSRDLALSEVRRVDVITLHGPEDVSPALGRLLAPHAEDLAMTWIADVGSSLTERAQIWTRLLRRLNERRDALREAHPRGLVLVCPPGSLPLARDEAPDLWSFRSLTATLDPTVPRVTVPPPRPDGTGGGEGRNPVAPVAGAPIRPSPAVQALLQRAASAVRSGRTNVAVSAGLEALTAAESPDDAILAHAWLAQACDRQGELVEAMRHARLALTGQRPLEPDTTVALLGLLTHSPDREMVLNAATALVDVHRELLRRHPDTPEALRDLSISLDKVAGIQQRRGQLDEALDAYTEALQWYALLDERYGPPFADPDELAALQDAVASIPPNSSAR